MNERILELAQQVGAVRNVLAMGRHDGVLFTETELERFAQLIVEECIRVDSAAELEGKVWWTDAVRTHFRLDK
jgi:hypothetical protein